jgi:hypothetical protein
MRIYGTLAIGLALFLITLACWRPPIRAHVAVSQLEVPQPHAAGDRSDDDLVESVTRETTSDGVNPALQRIMAAVQTPEFLDQAIPAQLKEPRVNNERPPQWQLSERLRIESRPRTNRAAHLIRIRYLDPDPVRAFQVVKRVTEQLQQQLGEQHSTSFAPDMSVAEVTTATPTSDAFQVDALRCELQSAEQELEAFLQAELSKCRANFLEQIQTASSESTADAQTEGGSDQDNSQAFAPTDSIGSETGIRLSAIQQDVQVTEYELDRLLKERTPEHPSVIMVEAKLRDLRSELSKLQTTSGAENPTSPNQPPTEESRSNATIPLANGINASEVVDNFDELEAIVMIKSSATYADLSGHVESLREQCRAAESAVASADNTSQSPSTGETTSVAETGTASSAALAARVVTKPYIAHRLRAPLSRSQVIPAGLSSMGMALLLMMIPASRVKPAFFTSAHEAAGHLGMRLVGQLPTGDGQPLDVPKRAPLAKLTKHCVQLSEWFIVIVACTLVVLAAVDSQVGHNLVSSPLQAYLQAVDGVLAMLTGTHV